MIYFEIVEDLEAASRKVARDDKTGQAAFEVMRLAIRGNNYYEMVTNVSKRYHIACSEIEERVLLIIIKVVSKGAL